MQRLRKAMPWVVAVATVALLLAHALKWTTVKVDGITLGLLGVLLLIPYMEYIRKIRLGEFEAEIAPQEVERVRDKAASELPPAPQDDQTDIDQYNAILDTVRADPPTGLFKLRYELDRVLRAIALHHYPGLDMRRFSSPRFFADLLSQRGVITPEIASTIRDIAPLLNRATHGEYIRTDDAEELARVGIRVLAQLNELYREMALAPAESRPITQADVEAYSRSRYCVTTVVPLAEDPKINVYYLNQPEIGKFLEAYATYAEFVVKVERLGQEQPSG